MILPPYLKKGDTIGMVCPAGFMAPEKWQRCVTELESWGFVVRLGATMNSASSNYFSGTDSERLKDLQTMLDDKKVKAILFGRGGYGMGRIIDRLDFQAFQKNPKWVIGYSDITVLHAHLNRNYKIASLHAPMAGAFNRPDAESPYIQSLKAAITGEKAYYRVAGHPYNNSGIATGRLIGGNLSLIAHLIGTSSSYKTKGKLLFLEDVGEQLYNIDRMLYQLKRAGLLHSLAGLIIGGFTDNKDTERPFGKPVLDIIREIVKDLDCPVCFQFPVSHEAENLALKVGGRYRLRINAEDVLLEEMD